MAEERSPAAEFFDQLEACDLELGGAITALTWKLHKCKVQRDELLAVLKAILTFDFDTILAAAGGEPYSEHYDWSTVLEAARAATGKARGEQE